MRAALFACLIGCLSATGYAAESLEVCFNYGCASRVPVALAEDRLVAVAGVLAAAVDADTERAAIARAVGMLYRLAGEQTPIAADRGGNLADDGVVGRMDCIDHARTTTNFLALMAARGWLRFHRVLPPQRRTLLIFQHFSAAIEELDEPRAPPPVPAPTVAVPDHVAPLLALCDCGDGPADGARPAAAQPPAVPAAGNRAARFAVDSWFMDHGDPAVVLPLAAWRNGEGPDVQ